MKFLLVSENKSVSEAVELHVIRKRIIHGIPTSSKYKVCTRCKYMQKMIIFYSFTAGICLTVGLNKKFRVLIYTVDLIKINT